MIHSGEKKNKIIRGKNTMREKLYAAAYYVVIGRLPEKEVR